MNNNYDNSYELLKSRKQLSDFFTSCFWTSLDSRVKETVESEAGLKGGLY